MTAAVLTLLFLLSPLDVKASEFYGFCETEPGHLASENWAENLKQVSTTLDAATSESPVFSRACQDPNLFKDRPKTGMFQRSIPQNDLKGRSTPDFLKRVAKRVLESMKTEELKLSVREDCLRKKLPPSDIGCKDTMKWLKEELAPFVTDARMNLALAQTTGQLKTLSRQSSSVLNSKLDSLGTHKEVKWLRLDTSEVIKAEKILAEYKSEMREAVEIEVREKRVAPETAKKFENDGLLAARYTNGLAYVEALSQNPILQYLFSPYALDSEVAEAISKMREHLKSDRRSAEEALSNISDPSGLGLLNYASHVEAELLENPSDCGLATSLIKVKESRSLGNGLAIGIPLVVVSIGLPVVGYVAAGAALGVASGVGYSVYSYYEMTSARERFISRLKNDDPLQYDQLDQADREFKISYAMGPAAMALAPAARMVSIGLRAAKVGSSLSRSQPGKKR